MESSLPSETPLTVSQRRWGDHLEAWAASGGSLRAYAAANDLSLSGLYSAKRDLTQRGVWPRRAVQVAGPMKPKLLPVRITTPVPVAMLRVLLPNGTAVEVPEHADPERTRVLLATVGSLP